MKKKQPLSSSSIKILHTNFLTSALSPSNNPLSQHLPFPRSNSISTLPPHSSLPSHQTVTKKQAIPQNQRSEIEDNLTETTVRKNKKIVLKKGGGGKGKKGSVCSMTNRGKQNGRDKEEGDGKEEDSFLDETFRTSVIQSLKNSREISVENFSHLHPTNPSLEPQHIPSKSPLQSHPPLINIDTEPLFVQFSKKRSSIYHLISNLDGKFEEIESVEFKKKRDLLSQLSDEGYWNRRGETTGGKEWKGKECMSLRMVYEMEKRVGEGVETSVFKL